MVLGLGFMASGLGGCKAAEALWLGFRARIDQLFGLLIFRGHSIKSRDAQQP